MAFKVLVWPSVDKRISAWKLSDFVFVEVYLRLREDLPSNPPRLMRRATSPFDGMVYEFELIDPENRLCQHLFTFQVVYSQDEETLIIAKAGHERRDGI